MGNIKWATWKLNLPFCSCSISLVVYCHILHSEFSDSVNDFSSLSSSSTSSKLIPAGWLFSFLLFEVTGGAIAPSSSCLLGDGLLSSAGFSVPGDWIAKHFSRRAVILSTFSSEAPFSTPFVSTPFCSNGFGLLEAELSGGDSKVLN